MSKYIEGGYGIKTNALIHPAHNLTFFSRAFLFLAVFEEGVNGEINRTIC